MTESYRYVKDQSTPYLPPSALKDIAERELVSKKTVGIEYPGKGKAAMAPYYDAEHYEIVFLDPYTGEILKHKNMKKDFFRFILDGHYYLWLPETIGQPIAASATLIFIVLMITGIILWWPKNKAARKQRFSVKWNAKWRRKNYDLHNVLGFYMSWVAIFLAITGLVFGFQWFAKSVYWVTSGGQTAAEHTDPLSDSTKPKPAYNMADMLWRAHRDSAKPNEGVSVYFATSNSGPIEIGVNHRPGTYYNSDYIHYDQYTGKELPATGSYASKFADAKIADKIVRMNYDMHTGAVLGIPGKLLAFFASLIAASLPVTGFIIWWGRRKQSKKTTAKPIPAV